MRYHAKLEYGADDHFWWNHSEEKISEKLVFPFINGQVIMLKSSRGADRLFNMKNATFLRVYKTESPLSVTESKNIIDQIKEEEFQKNDCTAEFLNKNKTSNAGPALTSLLQKAFQPSKQQVFFIMKFGDEVIDSAYIEVYKPVLKKFNLASVRIDEIQDSKKYQIKY
ncbi:hypothetical protein [Aeromonas eucrenophila]|uniref:Uncharacterized protein n=1 Tax=Aeromonas eucrenophila TaxID=649 RepID=A0ABW0Y8Z8_9GAMM